MASKQAILLCKSFARRIAWGTSELDKEAALQETINSIYSRYTEEERADLYTRLVEGGFCSTVSLMSRRMMANTHINSWGHARVHGKLRGNNPTTAIVDEVKTKKEFTL